MCLFRIKTIQWLLQSIWFHFGLSGTHQVQPAKPKQVQEMVCFGIVWSGLVWLSLRWWWRSRLTGRCTMWGKRPPRRSRRFCKWSNGAGGGRKEAAKEVYPWNLFTPLKFIHPKIFTPQKNFHLKNIHSWKIFPSEKYSSRKNIHPWKLVALKIFTHDKYLPNKKWKQS